MEDEIKIVELELDNMTLKPSDLRMGGVIETKEGTKYMVLIIGAAFDTDEDGDLICIPSQHTAVVGEYVDGGWPDEDNPIYGTFYNLKLAPMDDEEAPILFSEKGEREDISEEYKEKLRNEPINVIEYEGRTLLQNLLFSVHSHPPEGLGIIYHEIDLERVCDHMLKALRVAKEYAGLDELRQSAISAQMEIIKQMKDFFDHKV